MLAYVILFLVSLSGAAIAVWVYRWLFNRQGFNQIAASGLGPAKRERRRSPQNFKSLAYLSQENAKYVTLSNSRGSIKTPWGW